MKNTQQEGSKMHNFLGKKINVLTIGTKFLKHVACYLSHNVTCIPIYQLKTFNTCAPTNMQHGIIGFNVL